MSMVCFGAGLLILLLYGVVCAVGPFSALGAAALALVMLWRLGFWAAIDQGPSSFPAYTKASALLFSLAGAYWAFGSALYEVKSIESLLFGFFSLFCWGLPWAATVSFAALGSSRAKFFAAAPFFGCVCGRWIAAVCADALPGAPSFFVPVLCTASSALALASLLLLRQDDASKNDPASKPCEADVASVHPALSRLEGYGSLSSQERQVLELSLFGGDVRSIGEELGIASSTVSSYRARCCQKLGVGSVQDITKLLLENLGAGKPGATAQESMPAVSTVTASRAMEVFVFAAACLASRMVASNAARAALLGAIALLVLSRSARSAKERQTSLSSILLGAACALQLVLLSCCSIIYLPVCAPVVIATVLLEFCLGRNDSALFLASNFYIALGLALLALCASSPVLDALSKTPFAALFFSLAVAVCAAIARREEAAIVMTAASDVILAGEQRVMSYLQGRGLGEVQAKVALLTVMGLDLSHIADALIVSKSTVSNYRAKVYAALGVHGRAALRELLSKECEFTASGYNRGAKDAT